MIDINIQPSKTRVTLYSPQDNFDLREIVKARMDHWFGGVEYPESPFDAQVFVFVSLTQSVSVLAHKVAQIFFERSKTEALVYEYDIKADTFVCRSQEWMDAHVDY